ncbi:hypothetical protein [Psychrobacillus sp. FSL K6-1415]|uniref:hypothetical protein n=1 Tax=Psychrobacillus sp. FSL K6-1415 TaxID=2921544 RepID=UPI0030F87FEA
MSTIKCLNCFELTDTFNFLYMNPLESIIEYDDVLNQYVNINDEETYYKHNGKLLCSLCKEHINIEDYYISSDKEEHLAKAVSELLGVEISKYINYCKNCEISRELEEVNRISIIEKGQKLYSQGIEIETFLLKYSVPEKYIPFVIPFLECQCCGYGYNRMEKKYEKGCFDDSFFVFNQDEISDFLEIDMAEWETFSEKYFIYIKEMELTNFLSSLKKSPMLAFKHSVGQKIYELFSEMYTAGDFISLSNKKLYRGRIRGIGSEIYQPQEMWSPPFGFSTHGRYNLIGTSVLYLTDEKKYIPHELNYTNAQELDIATIEVNEPLKILDLSKFIGDFGKFLSQSSNNTQILKMEYLLTNYISECCKEIGFNGIKYKGIKEGNYNNYAVFKYEKNKQLKISNVISFKVNIEYVIQN